MWFRLCHEQATGKTSDEVNGCHTRRTSSRVAALQASRVKTEPEDDGAPEEPAELVKKEEAEPVLHSKRDSNDEEDSDDENVGIGFMCPLKKIQYWIGSC